MAGFETHISTSTAFGFAYAVIGHVQLGLPLDACAVAGGLCSLGGMLPDLDSDSGAPYRETICLTSAVVPMIFMPRLATWGLSVEQMILAAAPAYLFIRFVLGPLLKEFSVHRGMFHSIPAMAIAGIITFLVCDQGWHQARLFKAGGVMLGFFSHLALDEIYSVEVTSTGPRFKKSLGTALKFFGPDPISTAGCYGLLILLGTIALREVPPDATARALVGSSKALVDPGPLQQTPRRYPTEWEIDQRFSEPQEAANRRYPTDTLPRSKSLTTSKSPPQRPANPSFDDFPAPTNRQYDGREDRRTNPPVRENWNSPRQSENRQQPPSASWR